MRWASRPGTPALIQPSSRGDGLHWHPPPKLGGSSAHVNHFPFAPRARIWARGADELHEDAIRQPSGTGGCCSHRLLPVKFAVTDGDRRRLRWRSEHTFARTVETAWSRNWRAGEARGSAAVSRRTRAGRRRPSPAGCPRRDGRGHPAGRAARSTVGRGAGLLSEGRGARGSSERRPRHRRRR